MSKTLTVYQTLKNKGNSAYVEREGPFNCNWENAWLGEGYYFWEAFINSAHWWGKNHCQNNYFICQAFCSMTDTNCFDLVGDTSHMQIFSDAIDQMKTEGLIDQKTTVTRILKYLGDIGIFKFEATRAVGYSSIGQKNSKYLKRMLFEIPKNSKPDHYLHYQSPIQICFYSKNSSGLKGYKIIFTYEYNQAYVL